MTELTISSEEIRSAISSYVSSLETDTSREEVGTVSDTGDGIAHVEGLPSAMTNELLEFPGGVLGVALNLDQREIGAVILGPYDGIEEGQQVKRTGNILSVPVGDAFLGRVINPLGAPIDGLGDIEAEEQRVLELQAASVMQRQSVSEPLQTGIKAIDAMTPIGRGQRQLIIGDRKTGKTAVCVDTIINQKDNWASGDPKKQVRCIYVAIGQKGSTIAGIRQSLEDAGALEYTTIVAAPASDPAGFKWLAPYTGSAIGQHWMYQGKHVLIIFDDLSKQAEAYRAISLLLRRPPGREAYPGDVFYLHSRLLERCAKLSDELGARLDDRPADHRDQGQRRLGLHPDQRHLDHRRPGLPGVRPVQPGRPAGHQRRHLGVPGGRRRAGQGHEVRCPARCGWTCRSTASWRRSPRSAPTWTPRRPRRWAAAAGWSSCSSRASTRRSRSRSRWSRSGWAPPASSTRCRCGDIRRFEKEFLDHVRRNEEGALAEIRDSGKLSDENVERLETRGARVPAAASRPPTARRWCRRRSRRRRSTRTRSTRRPSRSTSRPRPRTDG